MPEPNMESLFDEKEKDQNGLLRKLDVILPEILEPDEEADRVKDTSLVKVYERTIETSTNLTLKAQRVLRVVLSLITAKDKENKKYTFNVVDYQKIFNVEEYPIKQLKQAADELMVPREFASEKDPEGFTKAGLISYINVENGVVTFQIAPPLLPLYQSLKNNNQYMIGYTTDFESSYSFSFYELFLKHVEDNPDQSGSAIVYYTLEKLREWLMLENKYIDKRSGRFDYSSFKRRILTPIMNDINRKEGDRPVCNINVSFTERKVGRSVVGLEFKIWKSNAIIREEPKVNPYYDNLKPDVKLAYDAILALDILKTEIEYCITKYGEDEFLKIVHYIKSQAYKGKAYTSLLLRNGFSYTDLNRKVGFSNLSRAYTISDNDRRLYEETELFLRDIGDIEQNLVLNYIKHELAKEPYVYQYIMNLSLEEILNTKDVKIFFMERLVDALKGEENKTINKMYHDYFQKKEKEINIIEDRAITATLTQYGIAKTVWPTLLQFTDEHIQANIDYCVQKYRKGKGQKDISGVIVTAIKNDYAHYGISTKEKQLDDAKHKFDNELADGLRKAAESKMAEMFNVDVDVSKLPENEHIPSEIVPSAKESVQGSSIEAEFEKAYQAFMEEASNEDKESIKEAVISSMRGIQVSVLAKMFNVKKEHLHKVPVDQLLTSRIFEQTYRQTFRKEMGL